MNFKEFWKSLNDDEKTEFARRCEMSKAYIDLHLTRRRNAPKLTNIVKMEQASNGRLNYIGLCEFFKPQIKTPSDG